MESVGSFRFVNELKLNSSLPGLIGRHGAGVPGWLAGPRIAVQPWDGWGVAFGNCR